MFVVMLY